jgi:hypothetical protein
LVGDHCQLSPVCWHKTAADETCGRCHLSASHTWDSFTWHHLVHSVRQASDPVFLDFLGHIRARQPTQEAIDAALSQCVIPAAQWEEHLFDADTVLCTHNEDVDLYNAQLLDAKFPRGQVDCGLIADFNMDSPEFLDIKKFKAGLKNTRMGMAAVGAPIVYKSNIDVSKGTVNGASGHITGFKVVAGTVISIHTTVDYTGATIKLNRTWLEQCYRDNIRYTVKAFPCMLRFAMTGHASQGATLTGKILICIRSSFCPGLIYVMLNRVPCRAYIFLCGPPLAADFIPARPLLVSSPPSPLSLFLLPPVSPFMHLCRPAREHNKSSMSSSDQLPLQKPLPFACRALPSLRHCGLAHPPKLLNIISTRITPTALPSPTIVQPITSLGDPLLQMLPAGTLSSTTYSSPALSFLTADCHCSWCRHPRPNFPLLLTLPSSYGIFISFK